MKLQPAYLSKMALLYRCVSGHFAKSVRVAEFQSHPIIRKILVNFRKSHQELFFKISQNSQENACARISLFNFIKKETLAQVFSCEFCQISKNTFFYRTPLVAPSKTWRAEEKKLCYRCFPENIFKFFWTAIL